MLLFAHPSRVSCFLQPSVFMMMNQMIIASSIERIMPLVNFFILFFVYFHFFLNRQPFALSLVRAGLGFGLPVSCSIGCIIFKNPLQICGHQNLKVNTAFAVFLVRFWRFLVSN
jgi:hypothetical protein